MNNPIRISTIHTIDYFFEGSVTELFTPMAGEPYAMLLLGKDGSSYIASEPVLVLRSDGTGTLILTRDASFSLAENPLNVMERYLESLDSRESSTGGIPGAFFGYLGYEAGGFVEPKMQSHQPAIQSLPLIYQALFQKVIRCTPVNGGVECRKFSFDYEMGNPLYPLRVDQCRPNSMPVQVANWYPLEGDEFLGVDTLVTKSTYLETVAEIKELIRTGEFYQANFSQCLRTHFEGNEWKLFCRLYQENPANHYAFWKLPEFSLLSCSPESFLQLKDRELVAHPIKGTAPREIDPALDYQSLATLLQCEKNGAELNMIVDLFRNDLNNVCEPGSVRVVEPKYALLLENVHHLVAEIKGTLEAGAHAMDALRACFPSGSITGCPKIRSMEYLRQVEPAQRGVYSGSIGYMGYREINLSVAIRTMIHQDNQLYFQVGGGIVFDSIPELEYAETLHKARNFLRQCGKGVQA